MKKKVLYKFDCCIHVMFFHVIFPYIGTLSQLLPLCRSHAVSRDEQRGIPLSGRSSCLAGLSLRALSSRIGVLSTQALAGETRNIRLAVAIDSFAVVPMVRPHGTHPPFTPAAPPSEHEACIRLMGWRPST